MSTKHWRYERRVGRVRIELHVIRHQYGHSNDRWVIRPGLIVDAINWEAMRKRARVSP